MFKKDIIFIVLLCIITSILNGVNSIYSIEISILNLISTAIFLICLIGYSFLNGKYRRKKFINFIVIYWGIAFIINLTCILYPIPVLYPLAIVNFFPLYGIYYFVEILNNPLILIIINFFICIFFFLLGRLKKSNF